MKRYIQQRWTGNPRTSWWSPLDTDVFCRLPLPTLLYRHMFCCHCCDVSVSYVLLSKLSQICCFVVICLVVWLPGAPWIDWAKMIANNPSHTIKSIRKGKNSSQSTPSNKSTDTRGSQSIIKSMNSSHIPTVRLGDPDGLRRGWWTPMDMTQPEAVNWIHHFRTRTTHVNVIYSL